MPRPPAALVLLAAAILGCQTGARIQALPQTIAFAPPPSPPVNATTATVSATASSGLPVRYGSKTPDRCAVDAGSGLVTASASGPCTVSANQDGNAEFAAAPQAVQDVTFSFAGVITFGPAPVVAVHDLATVTATESAGLPVLLASATPSTCAVDPATGLLRALAPGDCTVDASAGEARASTTFPVSPAGAPVPPGAPGGVSGTAGDLPGTLRVRVASIAAGGSAITGWTVTSVPPGITGGGATLPVEAACPSSCAGYRVVVTAANGSGTGPPSSPGDVVTVYQVRVRFFEPDTRPNDSIFIGSYSLDSSNGTVAGLRGRLSEAMTGGPVPFPDDTMTWLTLPNQLSAVPARLDGVDGLLVTTFLLPVTDTLSADPRFGGTDGWEPGSGQGLHFAFPGANPGNAYVRVFVNLADPTAPASAGQVAKLAYADCAPGGMMGATCMTGTSVAGYGTIGTMGGYPESQVTTR